MTVRGFVEGDRDLCTIDDIASDGGTDGNLGAVDQPPLGPRMGAFVNHETRLISAIVS